MMATEQLQEESLNEWSDRIVTLTLDAFSKALGDLVETLAIENFLKGCKDRQSAMAIANLDVQPRTLHKALQKMKSFGHSRNLFFGKSTSPYRSRKVSFDKPVEKNDDHCLRKMEEWFTQLSKKLLEQNSIGQPKPRWSSPSPSGRSSSPNNMRCYRCNSPDHLRKDCKNPRSRTPSPLGSPGPCFRCGERGHLIRDCPRSPKDRV